MIGATNVPQGTPRSLKRRTVSTRRYRDEHLYQAFARHGFEQIEIALDKRPLGDDSDGVPKFP
jgi:hypothetical protein